jgi:hypothetical protein
MANNYGQFRTLDQLWAREDVDALFDADFELTELCSDGWEIQHIAVHVDVARDDDDYVHRVVTLSRIYNPARGKSYMGEIPTG